MVKDPRILPAAWDAANPDSFPSSLQGLALCKGLRLEALTCGFR